MFMILLVFFFLGCPMHVFLDRISYIMSILKYHIILHISAYFGLFLVYKNLFCGFR